MIIEIKKLDGAAKLPTRANEGDAGYDLYAFFDADLLPLQRWLIGTRISISIPKGYYGRIAPRSGLAFKKGIDVMAGVIDSTYRGEIGVILVNLGSENFIVKSGDKIAQLIIEKCHDVEWKEVEELDSTTRGDKGYGSSDLTQPRSINFVSPT